MTAMTPTQKRNFRAAIADFCLRAEAARLKWHYSQQRPFDGFQRPPEEYHAADCSGYLALAFSWAQHKTGIYCPSPLNASPGWGYTGTEYQYLKAHKAPPNKFLVGDMAIYGTTFNTVHTSICRKAGTMRTAIFSSNGHESWRFVDDAPEPTILFTHNNQLLGVFRHPYLL